MQEHRELATWRASRPHGVASDLDPARPRPSAWGPPLPEGIFGIEQLHWAPVPIVSTFFGITIRMYYREHGVPHFHAEYDSDEATFSIDGRLLAGNLRSRTASRLIREWARKHAVELQANWDRAMEGEPLDRIAPLE